MITTTRRHATVVLRARTLLLAVLLSAAGLAVDASPRALPRPDSLSPLDALAYACADGPSFQGWITNSTSSHPLITSSTSGNVYGWISTIIDDWSCTAFYRYDGLVWARNADGSRGNFAWGNLINSTSVSCNWVIGSNDYVKGNGTNDCPDSDAEYARQFFLGDTDGSHLLNAVFHEDSSPDGKGDFAFIHSDCESYYGSAPTRWNQTFSSGNTGNRPGTSNCDPFAIDATNNDQTIAVGDVTPPNPPSVPDLDPASDTGASATDNVTADTTPTFTGTAEASATVKLYAGANQVGSGTATGGAFSITASALGNGVHSITATATDAAGNASAASGALSATIDTVAPPAPSTPDLDPASDTGASATDNITSDRTPTFTGTAEANATVTLLDGASPIATSPAPGGSWSLTSSELPLGERSITATAADVAGNAGPSSGALVVTILASDLALAWPIEGATLFATEVLEVGDPGAGVTSVDYLVDGQILGSATAAPWTLDWDTTGVTDGPHTVQATAHAPGGATSSPIVAVTVDNTLASTERLDIDHANGRISLDDYAVNGVYAVNAPLVLPARYRSASPEVAGPDAMEAYLATWASLSPAAQDEISEFFAQPLRGPFYAASAYPSTRTPVQPTGISDACEHVETLLFGTLVAAADECTHETAHFRISYYLDGSGSYDGHDVASPIVSGVPEIIAQYTVGLEDAYDVYVDLGYRADWLGRVPVLVYDFGLSATGFVGFPAGELITNEPTTISLKPATDIPYYTAHHEVFHVHQGRYVSLDTAAGLSGMLWLAESTAEWAAGYVTRSGKPGDTDWYAANLPAFLAQPTRSLTDSAFGGQQQYGAFVFHEFLVEHLGGNDPDVIREIWERIDANSEGALSAIEYVVGAHGSSLAGLLPEFWQDNYLLDYDDTLGTFQSDVESVWRPSLDDGPTSSDTHAPARPARIPNPAALLGDGATVAGDSSVDPGGAQYVEFVPEHEGVYGEFDVTLTAATSAGLNARVMTLDYPLDHPESALVCLDTPLTIDGQGNGSITVPLTPGCRYAVLIVGQADIDGSVATFHWSAEFTRHTIVVTDSQWKTLELSWQGGTTNPEPTGWRVSGFDDASWSAAYIPTDPYYSWYDIPLADWLSSTGRATGHLTSEIWIARLEFNIDGSVPADATLRWNVDNKATIWINDHQLVSSAGSWSSAITTAVPAGYLQPGVNTFAVKVTQDANTNTWSVNPTMFQAKLTIPTVE